MEYDRGKLYYVKKFDDGVFVCETDGKGGRKKKK